MNGADHSRGRARSHCYSVRFSLPWESQGRPISPHSWASPSILPPGAYAYRADRAPEQNPPESWILLMQYANLPMNQPVAVEQSRARAGPLRVALGGSASGCGRWSCRGLPTRPRGLARRPWSWPTSTPPTQRHIPGGTPGPSRKQASPRFHQTAALSPMRSPSIPGGVVASVRGPGRLPTWHVRRYVPWYRTSGSGWKSRSSGDSTRQQPTSTTTATRGL